MVIKFYFYLFLIAVNSVHVSSLYKIYEYELSTINLNLVLFLFLLLSLSACISTRLVRMTATTQQGGRIKI